LIVRRGVGGGVHTGDRGATESEQFCSRALVGGRQWPVEPETRQNERVSEIERVNVKKKNAFDLRAEYIGIRVWWRMATDDPQFFDDHPAKIIKIQILFHATSQHER
jgi:hypothetical protein